MGRTMFGYGRKGRSIMPLTVSTTKPEYLKIPSMPRFRTQAMIKTRRRALTLSFRIQSNIIPKSQLHVMDASIKNT